MRLDEADVLLRRRVARYAARRRGARQCDTTKRGDNQGHAGQVLISRALRSVNSTRAVEPLRLTRTEVNQYFEALRSMFEYARRCSSAGESNRNPLALEEVE
jgi:hypothetical protein